MNYIEIKTMYGITFIKPERKEVKGMYWLTGISGIILMASPYLFNYVDNLTAVWTSVGAGLIVLAVSISEAMERKEKNWEYWVAGIVGVFAIIAPFVLGFGSVVNAMWSTVIMGAVIAFFAGSKLWVRGSSRA